MDSNIYRHEVAELSKLPRKRLLAEAAQARINMRGWMEATTRAWDIIEAHGLRQEPSKETLSDAVERNLLLVAELRKKVTP